MEFKNIKGRYFVLYIFILIFVGLCVWRLADLQIVQGNAYKEKSESRLIRAYPIKAPRGEIVDRFGRPLVTNKMGFYVQIQDMNLSDDELNRIIYTLLSILDEDGVEYESLFPMKAQPLRYEFDENGASDEQILNWKTANKLDNYGSASDVLNYYKNYFKISGEYSETDALRIISVRYDMKKKNFSIMTPFNLVTDIQMETVQKIKERSAEMPGVNVEIEPIREYVQAGLASHVLGRTGIIYEEEYRELKDKGYGMNDIIGKDGLEKVLESYLKGKDGYKKVEQTRGGNVSQVLITQEPTPGNYAVLTLDSKLQAVTEKALETHITEARSGKGKNAYCGAAVAVEINSGDVLAMASYPSYDLSKYNEEYSSLYSDSKKPLFNRALNGAYAPGSTFKPLVSIAALEEGIITPNTKILDQGIYRYYAPSYQPTCLIWKNSHTTHGNINVSEAIGVSCNYFFYEVGRLLTIEGINKYAKQFGLGESTGIELSESLGIVAGPEYRNKLNMTWYPGDTLQAAIGQSDNMYTPAQLASYVATLLNRGKRYGLHLVKEVKSYDSGEVIFKNTPTVLSETTIKEENFLAVKDGMGRVTEDGTAKAVFDNFPITVGGKTGTAEVSGGSDNVLFVGFAPYDNPQIAVAVVIEKGASSSFAAKIARDMFESYLGINEVEDIADGYNRLIK